jgi:hypothetical protein
MSYVSPNGMTSLTTNGMTSPATNGMTSPATNGMTSLTTNGMTPLTTNGMTSLTTNTQVHTAIVPGILNADYCGTEDNPSNFGGADRDPHSMNAGAPHLWFNGTLSPHRKDTLTSLHTDTPTSHRAGADTTMTAAGFGMVALDDVFRIHAQCTVRVFGQKFTLKDAIGSHACSLDALACV